ncbi:MAG: hypothetical protein KIT69_12280 [Propionibacteriaceae bacterium]|nr:hypothetical protein [Propionibacteriaceae bacterium]
MVDNHGKALRVLSIGGVALGLILLFGSLIAAEQSRTVGWDPVTQEYAALAGTLATFGGGILSVGSIGFLIWLGVESLRTSQARFIEAMGRDGDRQS